MARSKPRRAEHSAGAFYSGDPNGMIPVITRTLSDEYHDTPVDPPDDREPEITPPGLVDRIIERLRRGH
jgi:hypothetical protein